MLRKKKTTTLEQASETPKKRRIVKTVGVGLVLAGAAAGAKAVLNKK